MRPAQPTDPVQTARLVLTPVGGQDVDDLTLLYGDPLVASWTGPWSRAAIQAWTTDMDCLRRVEAFSGDERLEVHHPATRGVVEQNLHLATVSDLRESSTSRGVIGDGIAQRNTPAVGLRVEIPDAVDVDLPGTPSSSWVGACEGSSTHS